MSAFTVSGMVYVTERAPMGCTPVVTALLIPMTAHCTAVLPLDTGFKRLATSLSLHSKHLVLCLSLSRSYLFSQYVNNWAVKAAVIAFPGLCWVAYHVPHTELGSFCCHSKILERNNLKEGILLQLTVSEVFV